jgi:hypothetical protein
MGQFTELHTQLLEVLEVVKTAAGGQLRVYTTPPVALPETPCVFLLTPDEAFERLDTMTGESTVTTVLRLCVDAGDPQTTLLELADLVADTIDVWLWDAMPQPPIDRAKRTGMRGSTPVFGEIAVRGADFPIQTHLQPRPLNPPA